MFTHNVSMMECQQKAMTGIGIVGKSYFTAGESSFSNEPTQLI